MYCLVPVNWDLLGEEIVKGTSNGGSAYEAGTHFMALDVSEKYVPNTMATRTSGDFCSI